MVEAHKKHCWLNSEQIIDWAPGCGSGFEGKKIYSADLNDGWCGEITTAISPAPKSPLTRLSGVRMPHCIYEVSFPLGQRKCSVRCLFHGAKGQAPDTKFISAANAINAHQKRLKVAILAGIVGLFLAIFGGLYRIYNHYRHISPKNKPLKGKLKIVRGLRGVSLTPSRCH